MKLIDCFEIQLYHGPLPKSVCEDFEFHKVITASEANLDNCGSYIFSKLDQLKECDFNDEKSAAYNKACKGLVRAAMRSNRNNDSGNNIEIIADVRIIEEFTVKYMAFDRGTGEGKVYVKLDVEAIGYKKRMID